MHYNLSQSITLIWLCWISVCHRAYRLDVKQAREQGYKGKSLFLSGFTDFKYAQSAIHGVEYYLTKPIDEDELFNTVKEIKKLLLDEAQKKEEMEEYRSKARNMILQDILNNNIPSTVDFQNLNLQADVYQVVIYEKYSHHASKMTYRFSDLLKVTNTDNSSLRKYYFR